MNAHPQVAALRVDPHYATQAPYHPSAAYPEYPFNHSLALDKNVVYGGVRQLFAMLGMDRDKLGTAGWNPLGTLIKPGMTVLIKPNFVLSRHKDGKDLFAIITHPSVIRAIGDYVWIALKGEGRLIIADAPQYDCNWRELLAATQLEKVIDFWKSRPGRPEMALYDLRPYWSKGKHFASALEPLPGDPQGSLVVNLGRRSALHDKPHPEKLYGAVYQRRETIAHHDGDRHEYQVSRTAMNADVVISVPKLKVHKKVGVTLNVKGLVGISTNKNFLVHYSLTPPSRGGDQYPDGLFTFWEKGLITTERWMYDHLLAPRVRLLEYLHRSIYWLHNHSSRRLGLRVGKNKRMLDAGNWHGNDSAWRMAVDLLKVFLFADREGRLQNSQQRRTFSIVDGVVGGDRIGPLTPDPVAAGVLVGGENMLAVDLVATRLMGFDPYKIKTYEHLLACSDFDFGLRQLDDIEVICPDPSWKNCFADSRNRFLNFRPHPGWVGHLEMGLSSDSGD